MAIIIIIILPKVVQERKQTEIAIDFAISSWNAQSHKGDKSNEI